jgi:hypothetical protein
VTYLLFELSHQRLITGAGNHDETGRQKSYILVPATTIFSIVPSVTVSKIYEKTELYTARKYNDFLYLSHIAKTSPATLKADYRSYVSSH